LLANALAGFLLLLPHYCWLAAIVLLAGWLTTWLAIITYIQGLLQDIIIIIYILLVVITISHY
jgi:hypothetical protein